ncbi:MAG TPA: type II secretion system F family protein, partial [Armatimonadota bacterium]|nr:type II secretion system F family protein [Armatimonadota bacterium]
MPTYRYEAMNAQGQSVKQEVDANSEEEAIQKIRAMKLFPTSIKEKAGAAKRGASATAAGGKRKKSLALGGVSNKALTLFTRQLSTLQDAGLPIVRSLKILEGQQKPGALKNILVEVTEDVEGGMTFSEALSKHPRAFDKLYVNMVRAGEIGGVLDAILQRLADFREKAQRLKKQIIGAMIYPAAVITVAGGILAGIMTFIVPKFKKMFDELNVELPPMTQILIALSDFIANKWYWGLAIIFGTIIFAKVVSATSGGKFILDRV